MHINDAMQRWRRVRVMFERHFARGPLPHRLAQAAKFQSSNGKVLYTL